MYEPCKRIFDKYKTRPHVEVELRLGKINRSTFDTNIGKHDFNLILNGLQKYKGWEEIKQSETSVFYTDKFRVSRDEQTDETIAVTKTKLNKQDFNIVGTSYDCRFCVSQEKPVKYNNNDTEFNMTRIKKRTSFIRKNLTIDMTIVDGGEHEDLDNEDETFYEVELEIIDVKNVDDNKFKNILNKVENILDIIKSRE